MFKELRIDAGLTRGDLAAETGRSVNYLLKAEDLTFPTPPVALMEFWLKRDADLDRTILEEAYYSAQRVKRLSWLEDWRPRSTDTSALSFCRKWEPAREDWTPHPVLGTVYPTQYAVSKGLCVPASAVYFAENNPSAPVAKVILKAVDDLVDYMRSGEFHAKRLYAVGTNEVMMDLLRLRSELQ